jgi:hypothetical protein
MSSAGGTRLPTQQPCYFGYGVGRPRKGAKNQCAAYEKNKKERGWRTEGLLRQQVTEICGRSQAGLQRAEVILARRTESGFCCKNCFGCALQEARAFATLNQNTLRPAATQGARADAPLRPRPTELSFTAVFTAAGADAELRLRVLQSCGCVGDAARLRRTCRAFRATYASPEFQRHIELEATWQLQQWKEQQVEVRALQKALQQVECRDLRAAHAATKAAELRIEDTKTALERALWSRSAQRERRDDRVLSLAADKQLLEEEVQALKAEAQRLTLRFAALSPPCAGAAVELKGRIFSLEAVLPRCGPSPSH